MKKTLLLLLVIALAVSSCSKKKETDNLFKYKDYLSYNTYGTKSVTTPIKIGLAKTAEQYELTQELPENFIKISPKTEGKLIIENGRTLTFQPSENLEPDTEYTVTLMLHRFYENLPKDYRTYTFGFKTITPNFKVNLSNLQSYSKEWQYIEGSIETADFIDLAAAKKLLKTEQEGKELSIVWPETEETAKYFTFTIDSIARKVEDSKITVQWDGEAINAENKGERELNIPGKNTFAIVDVTTRIEPQSVLTINFSDPIKEDQDFNGLVTIEGQTDLRFEPEGNVLRVYPSSRVMGDKLISVFQGLKSDFGYSLKKTFSETLSFDQLKPEVRMISKGVILPNAKNTPLYFETVNLNAVDVRVIQIFEDNVLQFLQDNDLNTTNNYYIREVGRRIAKKTIPLKKDGITDNSAWRAHALDLSEIFNAEKGAIYRVELSFKKGYSTYACDDEALESAQDNELLYADESDLTALEEDALEEQYWDNELYEWRDYTYNWQQRNNPCHDAFFNEDRVVTTNILASDLGLIVKEGDNKSYSFATTNLLTAKPEPFTKVHLYNYQQQLIQTTTTDADGIAYYDSKNKIAFAVAEKRNDYAYAKLGDGNALSMSKFDVSGKYLQRGLKGFLYTERGVHRPGDTIHLTFALNDEANPLPEGHPLKLEVNDARGKLVERKIINMDDNSSKAKNNFFYFPIPTKATDPTGGWRATVSLGGAQFTKTLRVATVKPNRLKIKLDFKDEILDASKPIAGTISSTWLHGAPARNLDAEMEVTLRNANSAFDDYKNYDFTDPVRIFYGSTVPIIKKELSAQGSLPFSQKLDINSKAPGMLEAVFLTKVYEGGGDFSMDVFTKKLAPYSHFVGLRSPETHRYGSFYTDEKTNFDVVTVDAQGKPAGNREVEVKVFKIEWRWWWNRSRDNLSRYENSAVYKPYKEFSLTTSGDGKANFDINIPDDDGGRYLVRVIDKKSGHATGRTAYFYRNWWKTPGESGAENAQMLVFSADKESYKVGDEAIVTFPSGSDGKALVSIENGTEVLDMQWIDTHKGETSAKIKITDIMAPNAFVNISLLQPHEQTKNDLPIRLYGVIPLAVENPATVLHPEIKMPKVLKPEKDFNVTVSEKDNKPMTYTLAVVDEGLLDLTRFATPDIHNAFYTPEALGVKTYDVFDYVIGAYGGKVDNIYAVGGGDVAAGAKNRKADRFKPVVKFLGPFELPSGESQTHTITMPNYVGSVRTMVIAGDNSKGAYGKTEETTPVRTPLMVLASLPQKLSPGETVTLPVTVFAMEDKVKSAKITVKTSKALKPVGNTSQQISFNGPGEQIVNFKYEVQETDEFQTIAITANGNGESASYDLEVDVENPNPISINKTSKTLAENGDLQMVYEPFGVAGTNEATLEFSTIPPMDLSARLEYLMNYPYGCVEQTTSSAFPQLFLRDIVDLTFAEKQKIEKNVKATIQRLSDFQIPAGGLSYWPGQSTPDEWGTTYAGHFMLEAKQKGYSLPLTFLSNWLRYQKNAARQWRNNARPYNTSHTQAYRLYTLALAGQPELAAMNRLRESSNLSNQARWRLAAAYALAGKKDVAASLAQNANIDFTSSENDRYTYGSVFRNQAMALETMVILKDDKMLTVAESLATRLSSTQWLSTQETSYALLSISKMVEANGGKSMQLSYTINGKEVKIETPQALAIRDLEVDKETATIAIKNSKDNKVYVTLTQKGKLPVGEELASQKSLTVSTQFLDGGDNAMDVSTLRQGSSFTAKIVVTNTTANDIDNLALSQIFPSGWEIVNTSFTDLNTTTTGQADYIDIRDDRANFFFDLDAKKSVTFTVKLNASYLGTYYLPGSQAEAMYDDNYFARNKGRWIKVVE